MFAKVHDGSTVTSGWTTEEVKWTACGKVDVGDDEWYVEQDGKVLRDGDTVKKLRKAEHMQ